MNQTKDTPPTILMLELDDDTRPILKQNHLINNNGLTSLPTHQLFRRYSTCLHSEYC
jgi:hypothetical protein